MPVTAQAAWPFQTSLELLALPSAVPCARGHVRAVTTEWALTDLAEVAELLASELVTNALRASERLRTPEQPVVRIWFVSDQVSVVIHVWDSSDEMPVRKVPGPGDDGGRGLVLVEALAAEWGAYRNSAGKTVWARVSR
jgi:anti-sigma regulatory factor (Ser/Thr protein kinase)